MDASFGTDGGRWGWQLGEQGCHFALNTPLPPHTHTHTYRQRCASALCAPMTICKAFNEEEKDDAEWERERETRGL